MDKGQQNIRLQLWIVLVALVLFSIKILAWYLTRSVAILTDALESIVNVIAGFVGLYSLSIAYKPRDANHPYGHGKAEFLSAAIEGTLIMLAGIFIIYEAIYHLFYPRILSSASSMMPATDFRAMRYPMNMITRDMMMAMILSICWIPVK